MKNHTITITFVGVIIAAMLLILALTYTPAPSLPDNTSSPNETSSITPTPDVTQPPTALSPYNPDAYLSPNFTFVHQTDVVVEGIKTLVDTELTPAISADVADICTVTIPSQPSVVNVSEIRLYVFAHEKMKDPFLHDIQSFPSPLNESEFTQNADKTASSQFSLGYAAANHSFVDIVITYQDIIIAYQKISIHNTRTDLVEYWQYRYPDHQYTRFYIQYNDTLYPYFYISTNGTGTLRDWVLQETCTGWRLENGYLVNANSTMMIHEDLCTDEIQPDCIYLAIPYQKHIMNFDFGEDDPTNAISFLGITQEAVVKRLGAPDNVITTNNITCMQYNIGNVFVVDDKVEQLNLKPNTLNVAHGLPASPKFHWEVISSALTHGVVPIHSKYITDKDVNIYSYYYTIQHPAERWAITYGWYFNEPFRPEDKTFTEIIIHRNPQIQY